MKDEVLKLKSIIDKSNNIVFFGGAGVSTESKIPDFRSATGLYNYAPEEILSHKFFYSHTEEFYKFYKDKMIYRDAKPNGAHLALAKLESIGKVKAVITQNIDGLHQIAGSDSVFELHGSVHRNFCTKCKKSFSLDYVMNSKGIVPYCDSCNGLVKPDVVLYGEVLDEDTINNAVYSISKANTLIVGGTSLVVYPAAGLIRYFNGSNLILLNKTETSYDSQADLIIRDNIGETLYSII